MTQAADRRQPGATSTPPSLPAPGWRRDLSQDDPGNGVKRAPPGALCIEGQPVRERPPDRPARVMFLAPIIGLALWVLLLLLLFERF